MAALKQLITNKVVGDAIKIDRVYTGMPGNKTIAKAWLTVKADVSQADVAAALQLSITGVLSAAGQITQTDTDNPVALYFLISKEQSAALIPQFAYQYDIQLISSDLDIFTAELGQIRLERGITDATS